MSTLKPISAPLDRASELRSDEAALDRLWSAAKIIRVSDSKLASDGKSLQFLNAAEVEKLISALKYSTCSVIFYNVLDFLLT